MLKITNREEYHQHIRNIRIGLKRPWMEDFILKYFGKSLPRKRYKNIESRIKNYLNGVSFVSGIELGLNEKIVEFYNNKNHASTDRKSTKDESGLQQESVSHEG